MRGSNSAGCASCNPGSGFSHTLPEFPYNHPICWHVYFHIFTLLWIQKLFMRGSNSAGCASCNPGLGFSHTPPEFPYNHPICWHVYSHSTLLSIQTFYLCEVQILLAAPLVILDQAFLILRQSFLIITKSFGMYILTVLYY